MVPIPAEEDFVAVWRATKLDLFAIVGL